MSPRLPVVAIVLALVLTALGGRFAVHMLQHARHGGHGDFATLYTAAHVYRDGGRIYDSPAPGGGAAPADHRDVHEAARRLGTLHAHDGFQHIHLFSYPPFTVLPFVPLTALPFRTAAMLWQALSLGFLAWTFWCLWRVVPMSSVGIMLVLALALLYEPLENSLGLGQINLLILALTSTFLWAVVSGRPRLAGVVLGVATALRVHPGIFLLYLAWRRQWRALFWGTATAASCTALALVLVGWRESLEYVTVVAPAYARTYAGPGGLSLGGWLSIVGGTVAPGLGAEAWQPAGRLVSVATLAAAFWALRPPRPSRGGVVTAEIAFLTGVLLLVVPNTTINHLVFTLIPLAVVLEHALATGERGVVAGLGVVVLLVGAIDDYYAHPRLHGGPQVVLAGIKTYGLGGLTWLAYRVVRARRMERA